MSAKNLNWDGLRAGLYGISAATFGTLGSLELISDVQVSEFTTGASNIIGAIFFLLAILNVSKGKPSPAPSTPAPEDPNIGFIPIENIVPQVQVPNFGAIQDVLRQLQAGR